jgi:hypothetical protein
MKQDRYLILRYFVQINANKTDLLENPTGL